MAPELEAGSILVRIPSYEWFVQMLFKINSIQYKWESRTYKSASLVPEEIRMREVGLKVFGEGIRVRFLVTYRTNHEI